MYAQRTFRARPASLPCEGVTDAPEEALGPKQLIVFDELVVGVSLEDVAGAADDNGHAEVLLVEACFGAEVQRQLGIALSELGNDPGYVASNIEARIVAERLDRHACTGTCWRMPDCIRSSMRSRAASTPHGLAPATF